MMSNKTDRYKQRGDTIIEVMVAVAILGLAFAISYATASHALQVSQNAQEHSRALQILNSQVEMARSEHSNPALYDQSKNFCLKLTGVGPSQTIGVSQYSAGDPSPPNCLRSVNSQAKYSVFASYRPVEVSMVKQDIFTFTVTWPGAGDLGQQQEQISYKMHQ